MKCFKSAHSRVGEKEKKKKKKKKLDLRKHKDRRFIFLYKPYFLVSTD
jgi:hypothetical protein